MIPIGQRIDGRYEVQAVLSPGSQGEVYRVLDHHEMAVGVLKLLNITQGDVWEEARILRALADDHILPIRNASVALGRPYIVTALAEHGTLEDRLNATGGAGLKVDDVIAWIRQACMGVARAHDARLVHNDLKPANLFLNTNGECLVGDFGVASFMPAPMTAAPPRGATAETVAPEVAATFGSGLPTASFASDVYSLGATAYWLLAGSPPIDLSGVAAAPVPQMAAAASQPRRALRDVAPHVPQAVAAAIHKAIAPSGADRYPTVGDFAAALGSRTTAKRRWRRTNEHAAHYGCWRGERLGGSTYVLCVEQGARASQRLVTTKHLSSGARVPNGGRTCTEKTVSQAVRGVINKLA